MSRFLAQAIAFAALVTVVAVGVALWRSYDIADAVALGLIFAGAGLGLLGTMSWTVPLPGMPGLEREYVRHVLPDATERWQRWGEAQARILTGVLIAGIGVAVQLLA